ncbi:IS110 family transposase [Candidatus Paracaedibacter symbiosus]|uniref:IS110 family transposase n=2 Tax=Candidatus Paracaedibacter symbiosus TaxID=244582 RepID=UPI000A0667CC|nr:IS110 family transposase [Candidatus Paracaedibacter symbiosus]
MIIILCEANMQNVHVIGIDISKKTFDACAMFNGKNKKNSFNNNGTGCEELISWIKEFGLTDPHICMESTGSYSEAVADFLYNSGYKVSVINPLQVKSFRISKMIRQKTDKSDCEVIAMFCLQNFPVLWSPKSRENKELHEVNARIDTLKMELNRLINSLEKEIINKIVANSINEEMQFIKDMIKKLEQEALNIINDSPQLKRQYDILTEIKGIGTKTAMTILADMPDVSRFENAKQYAAFVGVTPSHFQSGTSVKGKSHISRLGSRKIRKALYMSAIVVKNHNNAFQAFVNRLVSKGKRPKVIIVAIMRKLLHIFFGILKSNKSFNQNLAFHC